MPAALLTEKGIVQFQDFKIPSRAHRENFMTLIRELVFPLAAVLAAFVAGAIIILFIGDDPVQTYGLLIGSALSWPDGIGYTLFYATPLIFTGLAVAVGFRCGLLNIGAEGQLTVAALATAWAGIFFAGSSAWILIPLACAAAILSGAIWAGVPGLLKARFGSHEVINTIMMNFIAVGVAGALTQTYLKVPGDPVLQTGLIAEAAHIPRLGRIVPGLPDRIPLNLAFVLAVTACAVVYVFLWRTKWGYEIRATGASPSAAEYGGISVKKQIVLAMAVSGGLAGMVAINEVLGYRYRYYQGFSPQYGFTGIAVALLGRNHPVGVLLAALFFGALNRGGLFVDIFTDKVSKDLVLILQALVILFVAAEAVFRRRLWKTQRQV
jgi:simple sugar transport system permease protein